MPSVFAPLAARLAHGGDGVGGFARLGDENRQIAGAGERIAIAELAGVIHFHRQLRQPLDHELAGQSGVPAGAAGGDVNLLQLAEVVLGDVHLVEEDFAGIERDAAQRGIADGARLLIDFLEHEMLEAALLRHDRVPGDVLHLARDGLASKSVSCTPMRVMTARSPSARKNRSRV